MTLLKNLFDFRWTSLLVSPSSSICFASAMSRIRLISIFFNVHVYIYFALPTKINKYSEFGKSFSLPE